MDTMTLFTESVVEDAALGWFAELGYALQHGPDIAPDVPDAELFDSTRDKRDDHGFANSPGPTSHHCC